MRNVRAWFALMVVLGVGGLAVRLLAAPGPVDIDASASAVRPVIERYQVDKATLERSWSEVDEDGPGGRWFRRDTEPMTPAQVARMRRFYTEWSDTVRALPFDSYDQASKIDYLLLKNRLEFELSRLDAVERRLAAIHPIVAFGDGLLAMDAARRRIEPVNAEAAARTLDKMLEEAAALRASLDEAKPKGGEAPGASAPPTVGRELAGDAAAYVARLRVVMKNWFAFYDGYDPQVTWWVSQTYKDADKALEDLVSALRHRAGGGAGPETLGIAMVPPVGRDALLVELRREFIPYTPEDLIAIAESEYAWCEREMVKASREMGFGDDWHAAMEKVKTMHAAPGGQPEAVRKLVEGGIDFVETHDLVTVPPLAREIWRMEMIPAQQQQISPFFLGGESIMVSYPTDTMTYDQKMMSMRGNNVPFSHATAYHEEIPGHLLQGFMLDRYRVYRGGFYTPFFVEGNALWWEMLFYDLGYSKTPEDRIGQLFWRMHRCVRIVFSLGYHLGTVTPRQAVDMLVKRVGHEPDTAAGEVRRSFQGSYPPLYQCAYMIGALQFRALHHELVDSGRMTNRAFHDAVLKENAIPVELVRADLAKEKLTRDFKTAWRFYGTPAPAK